MVPSVLWIYYLWQKWTFADASTLRVLRWEDYLGLSRYSQCNSKGLVCRGRKQKI